MKTVPDKCPFCESPIIIHGGNPLRSEDGGFATYECKTSQDAKWDNDQFIRVGQSDVCRFREVIMLKKQRDEANERIKRLEEAGDELAGQHLFAVHTYDNAKKHVAEWYKSKEGNP